MTQNRAFFAIFSCLFLSTLLGNLPLAAAEGTTRSNRPPNIILMMADDLGYGDLGCYGQARIQTPHLDRMAKEGLRFTDFYAGSTVCAPSRCTLMTGLHSGHSYIRGNAKQALRPSDVTMPQILKQAGYKTGLYGKWGLGNSKTTGAPNQKGFDEFFGYTDQVHAHNHYPSFLWKNGQRFPLKNIVPNETPVGAGVSSNKLEYSHDVVTAGAMEFIDQNQNGPFFLYLAWTLPHTNNEAKKEGMEVPSLGVYENLDWPAAQKAHAAMITHMDKDVGRLLAKLKQLGLDENTIVLFTSDNGPHSESGVNPLFNHSSGFLKGHKRSLTDGGIRVPLIARWPSKITADQKTDLISFNGDLFPTFAELATASDKVPAEIDGLSILPTLLGQKDQQKQHDYLYWAFYEQGGGQAIRKGDWKLVEQPIGSPPRLYDLTDEVIEGNDRSSERPELVTELTKLMADAYKPSEEWKFPEANVQK